MKNNIYEHKDYRLFLKSWMKTQPKKGRGQMGLIAKHLNMSSVSISYVFNGNRNFSEEQALEVSEFLGLTEPEEQYFLIMVQWARAGSKKLESRYLKRLEQMQEQAQKLKNKIPVHHELDERAKAQFYSNWYFSAIRLLTSIDGMQTTEAIAEFLQLPRARVMEVINFLLKYSLCEEHEGQLRMGPSRTHIDEKSILVATHHRNWRLKAIEHLKNPSPDDFFFSGPMTVSKDTLKAIKDELINTTSKTARMIDSSPSEVLACINFDLFKIRG